MWYSSLSAYVCIEEFQDRRYNLGNGFCPFLRVTRSFTIDRDWDQKDLSVTGV